jgi:cystathionine beta-lyase
VTLIDNTWGAGLSFKPLAHGIDISIQALTKYVCGHSDVFLGSACTNDAALADQIRQTMVVSGFHVSGDDAALGLRGLRTLKTRYEAQGAAGLVVADWLAAQPEVARVLHPARPDDRYHALWKRDFTGTCSLFSIVLKPFAQDRVEAMLDNLDLFGLGFSWGGFESLVTLAKPLKTVDPWKEGHLIRLHIGLEDPADLIADLRRGLDRLHG